MSVQGATLQNYNQELIGCLEDLREKREVLNKTIAAEEKKKAEIQRKLEKLTSQVSRTEEGQAGVLVSPACTHLASSACSFVQLHRVNDSLSAKAAARNEYDVTIQETEAAYMKVSAPGHGQCKWASTAAAQMGS